MVTKAEDRKGWFYIMNEKFLDYCFLPNKDGGMKLYFTHYSHYQHQTQQKEGYLIITPQKNNAYIPDFFKDSSLHCPIEISAIVGNNGVGKSTILYTVFAILNHLNFSKYYVRSNEAFLAFRSNEAYWLDNGLITFCCDEENEKKKKLEYKLSHDRNINKPRGDDTLRITTLYHSFTFDSSPQDAVIEGNHCNLSTTGILARISQDGYDRYAAPTIANFRTEEVLKQVRFLCDMLPHLSSFSSDKQIIASLFEKSFGFPPNDLTIYLKTPYDCMTIFKKTNEDEQIKNILGTIWGAQNLDKFNKSQSLIDCISYGILINLIRCIEYVVVNDNVERSIEIEYLTALESEIKKNSRRDNSSFNLNSVIELLAYSETYFDNLNPPPPDRFDNNKRERYISAYESISTHISDMKELCSKLKESKVSSKCVFKHDHAFVLSTFESIDQEDFKVFIDTCMKLSKYFQYMDFSWGYSSGESALLQLAARLYDFKVKNSDDVADKPILLLLDEADMFLHPEWQRIFIEKIINLTGTVFKSASSIQIILATHSPIMLSDIPKQNTIFLKKEDDKVTVVDESAETFAANIYSLFKNSFFIDNSMIGSFAERELKTLAKEINYINEESDIKNIKARIQAIGDDFVRKQFLDLFNMRVNAESEIDKLRREVKELEGRIKKMENRSSSTGEEPS